MLGKTSKCEFTVKFFLPPVVFLQTYFVSNESTTGHITVKIWQTVFSIQTLQIYFQCYATHYVVWKVLEGDPALHVTSIVWWETSRWCHPVEHWWLSEELQCRYSKSYWESSGGVSVQRILNPADLRRRRETATWCCNCCFDTSCRVCQSWRSPEFARAPRERRREELNQKSPIPNSHWRVCSRWECRPRSQRIDPKPRWCFLCT